MKANLKNTVLAAMAYMATAASANAHVLHSNLKNEIIADISHQPVNTSEKEKGKEAAAAKAAIAVPYFRIEDEMLSVNILSLDASPVEISVYDDSDELLHSEVLEGKQSLGKRFDFSEVREGTFLIVVRTKKNTFTEWFRI